MNNFTNRNENTNKQDKQSFTNKKNNKTTDKKNNRGFSDDTQTSNKCD